MSWDMLLLVSNFYTLYNLKDTTMKMHTQPVIIFTASKNNNSMNQNIAKSLACSKMLRSHGFDFTTGEWFNNGHSSVAFIVLADNIVKTDAALDRIFNEFEIMESVEIHSNSDVTLNDCGDIKYLSSLSNCRDTDGNGILTRGGFFFKLPPIPTDVYIDPSDSELGIQGC